MDIFGVLWVPDVAILLVVLCSMLYIYGTWPHSTLQQYGYKGPKPQPFLGTAGRQLSGKHYAEIDLIGRKQYGKVFALYDGRLPVIVSFDTDFLKQVLVKEFSKFTDRRKMYMRGKMGYSLLDLEGDEWKRMRNINSPFFSSAKLRGNTDTLDYCVNNLKSRCDKIAESGEVFNAKELLGGFSMEAICRMAFGVQVDSQSNPDHILISTCKKMVQVFNPNSAWFKISLMFPFLINLMDKCGMEMWPKGSMDVLMELLREAVEERMKSKQERPDFIQALIKAHEEVGKDHQHHHTSLPDHALTEDEMVAQVATFAAAGYDTVSTTSTMLLYNLANNPEWQEKVLDEINTVIGNGKVTYEKLKELHLLDRCLTESQRLFPSIMRTERKCIESTTINGHYIPKDTIVVIPIFGLHHDPEYWPDPETFNPERFRPENKDNIDVYAFHGFGQGPRNCVGLRLAQIEVKVAVMKIIQNFKVTVANRTKRPLKLNMGFFLDIEGGIWLQLEKRKCDPIVE